VRIGNGAERGIPDRPALDLVLDVARSRFDVALATVLLVGAVLVSYYETALTRYLIALRRK